MSAIERVLPYKSTALWKGVGLGVVAFVGLLAVAVPNLMRSKMSASRNMAFFSFDESRGPSGIMEGVQADEPKVIRKAQLALLVGDCTEAQKRIEALAATESGFIESSTVEENAARISLRVPSGRLDAVRAKLRDLAIRVRQDSIAAADVSKQYFDNDARLRNLRAEEQQFLEVMKKSRTVPDILAVTKSLSEIRGEIEHADAEFRHLKDEIALAQIDIQLSSQSGSGVHWAPGSSMKAAYNDLLQSLASFGDFVIWIVVNIPLIALWILMIFLLSAASWYVLRKAARLLRAMFGKRAPEVSARA